MCECGDCNCSGDCGCNDCAGCCACDCCGDCGGCGDFNQCLECGQCGACEGGQTDCVCFECEGGNGDCCASIGNCGRCTDNVCIAADGGQDICSCDAFSPDVCCTAYQLYQTEQDKPSSGGRSNQQSLVWCCWSSTPYDYGCDCNCCCDGDGRTERRAASKQYRSRTAKGAELADGAADLDVEPRGPRQATIVQQHSTSIGHVDWEDHRNRSYTLRLESGAAGQRPLLMYSRKDPCTIDRAQPDGPIPISHVQYSPGLRRCCGVAEGPAFLLTPFLGAGAVQRVPLGSDVASVVARARCVAENAQVPHNIGTDITWDDAGDWWRCCTCYCVPCTCLGGFADSAMAVFYCLCCPVLYPKSDCAFQCERRAADCPCAEMCLLLCPKHDEGSWRAPPEGPFIEQHVHTATVAVAAERLRRAGRHDKAVALTKTAVVEIGRRNTNRTWRRFCVLGVLIGLLHVVVAGGLLLSLELQAAPLGKCRIDTYECKPVDGKFMHRGDNAWSRARHVYRVRYYGSDVDWRPLPGGTGKRTPCPGDEVWGRTFTDENEPSAGVTPDAERECESFAKQVVRNSTTETGDILVDCLYGNWWGQFSKKKLCQTDAGREYWRELYISLMSFGGMVFLVSFPLTWWAGRGLTWRRRVRHEAMVQRCGPPVTGPWPQVMEESRAPEAAPDPKPAPSSIPYFQENSPPQQPPMNRSSFAAKARDYAAATGGGPAAQPMLATGGVSPEQPPAGGEAHGAHLPQGVHDRGNPLQGTRSPTAPPRQYRPSSTSWPAAGPRQSPHRQGSYGPAGAVPGAGGQVPRRVSPSQQRPPVNVHGGSRGPPRRSGSTSLANPVQVHAAPRPGGYGRMQGLGPSSTFS
eukprot:TRINITY_DN19979_c0_g1_i1.p1 TRINITY_DN19979_c0_g1~~TRINITY_DN19979_c0_g1_i1.p1  ORF type:complete len:880 (+),score=196.74 TRINITY_DN19979_c0_g1_i1:62-2641(+)